MLVNLYLSGRLKIDPMISRTYRLEEINDAYEALERGEVARSVIVFDRS
jgi:S-(hydroxymethyl)glutathione dehydrogenase/alcohol dehydrogenase